MLHIAIEGAQQSAVCLPHQDNILIPHISPALRMTTDSEGAIVYVPEKDLVHMLNVTAAALLLMCDGTQGFGQVIESAIRLCPELPESETRRNFSCWLQQAEVDGLLSYGKLAVNPLQSFSPAELSKLADKLYSSENYQDAYRCARKVVEMEPTDADHWRSFGDAAHTIGRYSEACSAYMRYQEAHPDDAEIAHHVASLSENPPPPQASNEYIVQVFDDYAESFDHDLLTDLKYRAPELLLEKLLNLLPAPEKQLRIVDLGCGTGLAGKVLHPWGRSMIGVDLSCQMGAKALATGVYNEIHVTEITSWLESSQQTFDLILAADVLVYVGDLLPVLHAAKATLTCSSMIAFTLEVGLDPGYELTVSGRYAHHVDYVYATAKEAGFAVLHLSTGVLRTENNQDVPGHVVILMPQNEL